MTFPSFGHEVGIFEFKGKYVKTLILPVSPFFFTAQPSNINISFSSIRPLKYTLAE